MLAAALNLSVYFVIMLWTSDCVWVCFLPVRWPPVCAAAAAAAAAEEAAGSDVMPAEWETESKGCWELRLGVSQ